MGFYKFHREQTLNTSIEELWNFIFSPQNFKKITPNYMGFDICSKDMPNKVYEGMIINYIAKPIFGIKKNV